VEIKNDWGKGIRPAFLQELSAVGGQNETSGKTYLLLKPGNSILQGQIIHTTFINVRERRSHLNRTIGIVALFVMGEGVGGTI
jgi:hypothetical protein